MDKIYGKGKILVCFDMQYGAVQFERLNVYLDPGYTRVCVSSALLFSWLLPLWFLGGCGEPCDDRLNATTMALFPAHEIL